MRDSETLCMRDSEKEAATTLPPSQILSISSLVSICASLVLTCACGDLTHLLLSICEDAPQHTLLLAIFVRNGTLRKRFLQHRQALLGRGKRLLHLLPVR